MAQYDSIHDKITRPNACRRHLAFLALPYNGEVTKLTWPSVTKIKKVRDKHVVATDGLMISWKFIWSLKNCSNCSITNFFGGRVTWPDLRWPGVKIYRKCIESKGDEVAALPAAVFFLLHPRKTWGGSQHPSPLGRGLTGLSLWAVIMAYR